MKTHPNVGPVFLITGILAVTVNVLLLILGFRINKRRPEINYALCLAGLDLIGPFITIAIRGTFLLTGYDLRSHPLGCSIIGASHFVAVFLSMLFVMLVSGERYSVVFRSQWNLYLKGALAVYVTVYLALVSHATQQGLFVLPPDGFICSTKVDSSPLAASILLVFGFSLTMFLIVTTFCYMRILNVALNSRFSFHKEQKVSSPVTFRTLLICLVYFVLVAPSGILLMLRSLGLLTDSLFMSLVTTLSLFFLTIANPFLVIFAHSSIFDQLRSLLGITT